MNYLSGILFAFGAFLCWGFGDFFIQRTTKLVGSWRALLYITITGAIGLFPFIFNELHQLNIDKVLLLSLVAIVILGGTLFDFEALRQGKIAIVEPIISLELPLTVILSMVLLNEKPSTLQIFLILIVFIGIILAITAHQPNLKSKKIILEKGVILAIIGAIGMALNNFIIGYSSQTISPLMTIWFGHSLVAVFCLIYLLTTRQPLGLIKNLQKHPLPIIGQSILDNLAWIFFALATSLISISIATTISESYIALTVLLGIFINKEKLHAYQIIGSAITIIAVIYLSLTIT